MPSPKQRVERLARAAGMRITSNQYNHHAEVLIICRDGHCWPDNCHERVFDADTLTEAWQLANAEIEALARTQRPCAAGTCVSWDDCCGWWSTFDPAFF